MPPIKIKPIAELAQIRDQMDASGQRLVLTNGCFDLLHAGHVRYLQQARALGDAMVVVLNSDASVRALKGPERPLNSEEDRAEVLAALACVDYVTVCDNMRITEPIAAIRPHIYSKGGDYTVDSLDREEFAALQAAGADVRILPLVPGRSTTALINKWKQ